MALLADALIEIKEQVIAGDDEVAPFLFPIYDCLYYTENIENVELVITG